MQEGLFKNSRITPAARANDTSDIWVVRGGKYVQLSSRPFRSATIDHIKYGEISTDFTKPYIGADLGLNSITFTNDVERDYQTLSEFAEFRLEAERKKFRYFLEVFNPNGNPGFDIAGTGSFLNDHIICTLAGVTSKGRPIFLKIPYNGPGALEELAAYAPRLIIGILGGGPEQLVMRFSSSMMPRSTERGSPSMDERSTSLSIRSPSSKCSGALLVDKLPRRMR